MKTLRKTHIIIIAIVLLSFALSAAFYPRLPNRIASHWNAAGQVDDYMPRFWGAFFIPLINAAVAALLLIIPAIDPLKKNIQKFRNYFDGFIIVILAFMLTVHLWVLLWNVGITMSSNIFMPIGVGLLFIYIGILCPHTRRNWFIGIRTPWTLSSNIVWGKTHKIGGRLFILAGLIAIAGAILPKYSIFFIIIPIFLITAFVLIYSYVEYRKVGGKSPATATLERSIPKSFSGNTDWDRLMSEYMHHVAEALSDVNKPRRRQIMEDVAAHLNLRFNELPQEDRTVDNFRNIIDQMGPATDYAELLDPQRAKTAANAASKRFLLLTLIAFLAIVAAAVIISLTLPAPAPAQISAPLERLVDKVDYPFLNDPNVLGAWKSVDFVENPADFKPGERASDAKLYLNHLIFEPNGIIGGNYLTWTKGLVINRHVKTASTYTIKSIDGSDYLFFQWKSGDYIIRHRTPRYYVLKRVPVESVQNEAMMGRTADIPPSSTVDEKGRVRDKIDYPFVNDPQLIGAWETVDFVQEPNDFEPGRRNWEGDFFLK